MLIRKMQGVDNHRLLTMAEANNIIIPTKLLFVPSVSAAIFCGKFLKLTCGLVGRLLDIQEDHILLQHYLLPQVGRRIDFIFGTPFVLSATCRGGILSFDQGPPSDHRAIYVDLDETALFSDKAIDPTGRSFRLLRINNPEQCKLYLNLEQLPYQPPLLLSPKTSSEPSCYWLVHHHHPLLLRCS